MRKIVVNKEAVISSVTKMVADKAAVRSFETLTERGVKFAKPIEL